MDPLQQRRDHGKSYDTKSSLMDYSARWYSPATGRFTSKDTWQGVQDMPQTLNRYAYVLNNPINYTDPTGHAPCENDGDCYYPPDDEDDDGGNDGGYTPPPQPDPLPEDDNSAALELQKRMQEFASMVGLPPEMGSFLLEVLLAGIDSIPFVSNVLDAIRAFTGIDPLTGRVLSKKEQWTAGFFAIIPGGGGLKAIKNVINLAIDGYKTAKKLKTANNSVGDIKKSTNPEPGGTTKQATGCGNCFPAGTLVQTKDGPKAIETLQIGDEVLSKSDTTGDIGYKEIEQTFTRIADEIYTLTIGEYGREVRATGDHPFFVHNIGWVRTQNLQVGDELETKWGMTLEVKKIEVKQEETRVYNLSVADYHTYFVTSLELFTHNTNCEVVIELSKDKYPESSKHIEDAIADGQPEVLTINRSWG